MNLLCQLLCYGSLFVSPEDKNHLLIIEQMITQISTNREALKLDRNAINKLIYENQRLAGDLLDLQHKILALEKELKPPTEDEVRAALTDKLATKLVKYLIREIGVTKSLCLMTVFINDDNDQKQKKQQIAFDASVRSKLLKQRALNIHESDRLDRLARGDIELVLGNFKTDAVVFLVIEDVEDSFMDMWFKELPDNVVAPSSVSGQKVHKAQAPAPVRAQEPANFRFFKR